MKRAPLTLALLVAALAVSPGCRKTPTFVNIGGNRGVSSESIDRMARERGVSREEVIQSLRRAAAPRTKITYPVISTRHAPASARG